MIAKRLLTSKLELKELAATALRLEQIVEHAAHLELFDSDFYVFQKEGSLQLGVSTLGHFNNMESSESFVLVEAEQLAGNYPFLELSERVDQLSSNKMLIIDGKFEHLSEFELSKISY